MPHTVQETFASDLFSVRSARKFVRDSLAPVGWASSRLPDIELATSELSTNAVEYGEGTDFTVAIGLANDRITVAVRSSASSRTPSIQATAPDSLSGRGLWIVSTVADAMAIDQSADRVAVSCTFLCGAALNSASKADGREPFPTREDPNTR